MIDDSALIHGGAYDREKAHQYYLRTRKLKGRQSGPQTAPGGHTSPQKTFTPSGGSGGKPNRADTKSRQAQLQAQKDRITARLEHLREVLDKLVGDAKKRGDCASRTQSPSRDPRCHLG